MFRFGTVLYSNFISYLYCLYYRPILFLALNLYVKSEIFKKKKNYQKIIKIAVNNCCFNKIDYFLHNCNCYLAINFVAYEVFLKHYYFIHYGARYHYDLLVYYR